jgi:transposase
MATIDARSLPPPAQEALRQRAVQAIRKGMTQTEAAKVFGVSRRSICQWCRKKREGGIAALKARKRGRPPGSRLTRKQVLQAKHLIQDQCPDQLKLPFVLWTREAVQHLLEERFELSVSIWTAGRYLKGWGFTPQKPLRRAYERDPIAVKKWVEDEYPQIRIQAKREKAEIHWGDEMGLRSDHQTGRSYGLKGQTPVIPGTGQRFKCNLLSTITNRGKLAFMVFRGQFLGEVLIQFLRRLIRHTDQKVFLILDRHPVHRSREVRDWLEKHQDRIRLYFLPAYSPELNPDEMLNQDVKSNTLGRRRPHTQTEMVAGLRSYLRSRQRRPQIVKSYFKASSVRYAAD